MAKVKRRIKLECSKCKQALYFPNKSKGPKERLELNKFCKKCRVHTKQKETK